MSQKLICRLNKKGYLQIDFVFAILVFFMFFFVIYSSYSSYSSNFEKTVIYSEIEIDSRDLCFFLVNTNGNPVNWELDIYNVNFLGLRSSSNYSLDSLKIAEFNDVNYHSILDVLGLDDSNLNIMIKGLSSNSTYLNFGISSDNLGVYSSMNSCFSNYNSEPVIVFVEVWK
ncbi:MAG: hypothetical protein PF569_09695 [Candidatus Woesearchaeota archaeon]|jgi:hypothetical protein|nr:hypothetical protein [Candidatus Woesearchaeota archaeon]